MSLACAKICNAETSWFMFSNAVCACNQMRVFQYLFFSVTNTRSWEIARSYIFLPSHKNKQFLHIIIICFFSFGIEKSPWRMCSCAHAEKKKIIYILPYTLELRIFSKSSLSTTATWSPIYFYDQRFKGVLPSLTYTQTHQWWSLKIPTLLNAK